MAAQQHTAGLRSNIPSSPRALCALRALPQIMIDTGIKVAKIAHSDINAECVIATTRRDDAPRKPGKRAGQQPLAGASWAAPGSLAKLGAGRWHDMPQGICRRPARPVAARCCPLPSVE